jgi:ABC-type enterochelin transport system permease subunit
MSDLLTRLSPGTSLSRAVLAGALPVVGLLLRRISKTLVSEVHFTWIVRSSLVIAAVAVLVGTAFVVHRWDGVAKQTAEIPESAKCS